MFGIGLNEMFIILLLALVIIGPRRLPEVARTMGKLMAQFKRASNDLRDTVNKELMSQEGYKDLRDASDEFRRDMWDFRGQAERYIQNEVDRELESERETAREVGEELESHRRAVNDLTAESGDPGPLDSPPAEGDAEAAPHERTLDPSATGVYMPDRDYYGAPQPHLVRQDHQDNGGGSTDEGEGGHRDDESADAAAVPGTAARHGSGSDATGTADATDATDTTDADDGISSTKRASS